MRRVVLFGDSHIHAIQDAIEARRESGRDTFIEAHRLLKSKKAADGKGPRQWLATRLRRILGAQSLGLRAGSRLVGDMTIESFYRIARTLGTDDVLVSVIGGNQYAVLSTVQHPRPFHFCMPGEECHPGQGVELVPFRALEHFFVSGLRDGNGERLAALRRSTRAKMVHLLAPPPKRKNHYIEHYHDTHFAEEGIARLGVSNPKLRMKFWKLQNRAIEDICRELGIETVPPPLAARDQHGYLPRSFYAGDATHANVDYGELVSQQLEQRFGAPAGDGSHAARAATR